MKISGGERERETKRILRVKMPKGKGTKRHAVGAPPSQPTPKAPRRVSRLDLALQFGLYAVQNEKMQNVAELAESKKMGRKMRIEFRYAGE